MRKREEKKSLTANNQQLQQINGPQVFEQNLEPKPQHPSLFLQETLPGSQVTCIRQRTVKEPLYITKRP